MTGQRRFPLVIVTGLSGAGKSTALNVFEDERFFTVGGLPATLAPKLVSLFESQSDLGRQGLAMGLDLLHKDILGDWTHALKEIERLGVRPQIVFVEAKTDVLLRRYATTRRPHPLASNGRGLEQAIEQERQLLAPLRGRATLVIDTSVYSIHDLRRAIQDKCAAFESAARKLGVHVISFGFKYGVPAEADYVFDLRFLPNPYFDEKLRPLSGKDRAVADFVLAADPGATFMTRLLDFIAYLLPLFEQEGRYRLTIAIGCTGGRHRSVAVSERLVQVLRQDDHAVTLEHRHFALG